MSVRFQSGRTTVPHSGGPAVRRAGPGSGCAEQKEEGARQGGGRLWPGGPGRGACGGGTSCAGVRPLLMPVPVARAVGSPLGGWRSTSPGAWPGLCGSLQFTDEQSFWFPFFLPPAVCWLGRLPFRPMRAFPRQVLQTPVLSQTFLLETLGQIPL